MLITFFQLLILISDKTNFMKYSFIRLTLWTLISVSIFSCTKEHSIDTSAGSTSGTGSGSVLGTWNFAGFTAAINMQVVQSDGTDVSKTVATSNYVSSNNKGTVSFAANTFAGTGLGYDLNTNFFVEDYLNGVLQDTMSFPFNFTLPATNSGGSYKLVGADSLYFTGGFIAVGLDSMESKPIGYKYSISGNKLTMNTKFANSYNEVDNGITSRVNQNADIQIILQK